jgi:thiol-disulfide isomerase/thioredoxin
MPNVGDLGPFFSGKDVLTNQTFTLSEHKGKIILLAFNGLSWCGPCQYEAPVLQQLWEEHEPEVQFVMIAYGEDSVSGFKNALQNFGITMPALMEPNIPELYEIHGVPQLFFIDKELKICSIKTGADPPANELKASIEQHLTTCGAPTTGIKPDIGEWVAAVQILFGVTQDGGGVIIKGGRPIPIGPWDPLKRLSREKRNIVTSLAMTELADSLTDSKITHEVKLKLYESVENSARKLKERLSQVPIRFEKTTMSLEDKQAA